MTYQGSFICVGSSHLFLVAAIHNYLWCDYVKSILILSLYITSVMYHSRPRKTLKILDCSVCGITAAYGNIYAVNVLPYIFTFLVCLFYFLGNFPENTIKRHVYHASTVHFIGFLGMLSDC